MRKYVWRLVVARLRYFLPCPAPCTRKRRLFSRTQLEKVETVVRGRFSRDNARLSIVRNYSTVCWLFTSTFLFFWATALLIARLSLDMWSRSAVLTLMDKGSLAPHTVSRVGRGRGSDCEVGSGRWSRIFPVETMSFHGSANG